MENFAKTWVQEYGDALYGYSYSRVNDRIVAEDLVQDTFISALKGYKNFKHESSVKSWLISILKHKIIDHYRSKSRNVIDRIEESDHMDHLFNEKGRWKDSPQEWNTTPEEALQNKEFQQVLSSCVSKLPETQRQVFSFKDIDHLSGEDICKALNISPSNMWILTHRARHSLRTCLSKNWFGGAR